MVNTNLNTKKILFQEIMSILKRILPNHFYSVDVMINNCKDKLISIILIDTILLCGNTQFSLNPKKIIQNKNTPKYSCEQDEKLADLHFKQIEEKLKEISLTNVPYIIVGGHYPVFSAGENGTNKCFVDKLMPLLHKYKVSAYLSGHDHNMQHISHNYLNTQVEYIVVGSGCSTEYSFKNSHSIPQNSLRFKWPTKREILFGGFLLIEADPQRLIINFMKSNGDILYKKMIEPRK